ncbi:MAG: autotransporter-associated beta strand repeat-containing protein [Akkermansiaceae bacterium]|nr:autotransporter-associated beta strand repeat-containing protein [Akkermansiaceae bacterium]
MKNNILNTVRNFKFAVATFTALLLAGGASAQAQTSYTGTASTGIWNSTRWNNTSDASPYTSAWIANNAASFAAGAYTFTTAATSGVTVNVGNITLASGATVTFSGALGTFGTGGAVRTLDIGTGSLLDFGTQATSTAAGTGFIKNGAGVLATAGAAYSGGFTLNAGTVIMRGVDAMGGSASNVLTLNGGTVASNASRSMTTAKYGGGIVIGGNVQFGELATVNTLANSTANLSFANSVSLGSAARTFTGGNSGTQTFSGVISNTGSGGITFAANANTDGRFEITNAANTFTGPINITAGEVRFTSDGSIGNAGNDIILDGGRFGKASDSTTVTLGAGRDIFVGDAAGTAISSPGSTGTLIYNGVIANKSGKTGTWAKQGQGTLELGGSSSYTGATTINNGILKLTTGNNRLPTGTVVSLGQASSANVGTLNLNGLNQQIAGLASTTGINSSANKNTVTSTAAATLDINVAEGATSSYGAGTAANSGAITGAISLKKSGLGTQTLGDTNTYSGATTVDAGKLVINGSISTSTTTVNSTGTLAGSGTVGAVTVKDGGFIAPGNSPGILNTGNITLEAGSSLGIEIDGATVGTQYDRLNVTGSVSLAGLLSMTMSGSYAPANGTLFFILANDGTDAITGTFSNASVNGGTYTFGSQQFQISYAGDTATSSFTGGNDVVLQAVPEPASLLLGAVAILTLLRRRR